MRYLCSLKLRGIGVAGWVAVVAMMLGGGGCATVNYERANRDMRPGTGFVQQRINCEGRHRTYTVFVPRNYTPEHTWPAIVFLHGWMQGGTRGVNAPDSGLGPYVLDHARTFQFITIFPQSRNGWWEDVDDQDDVIRVLDAVQRQYSVDPGRVTLMGISTGGGGAWQVAARYRQRFASLVTMGGRSAPGAAPKVAGMPVWCFHYEADPVVSERNTQNMVDAVRKAGGSVKFTLVPGWGHYVWERACGPELFEWIAAQGQGSTMQLARRGTDAAVDRKRGQEAEPAERDRSASIRLGEGE